MRDNPPVRHSPLAHILAALLILAPTSALQSQNPPRNPGGNQSIIEQGLEAMRRQAEAGNAEAQYTYGTMFGDDGQATAAEWFRKAADQGHVKAQARLGVMYDLGAGVPKNQETALRWLTRAAQSGQPFAQYYLGRKYARGEGVARDRTAAQRWLSQSAQQNHAIGQFEFAELLRPDDRPQAIRWYRASAQRGYVEAQYALTQLLALVRPDGSPVAPTREQWNAEVAEVERMYRGAAENGHSDAQYRMAEYEEDPVEALKWLYVIGLRHRETIALDAHDRFEGFFELAEDLEAEVGESGSNEALEHARRWFANQPNRDALLMSLYDAP